MKLSKVGIIVSLCLSVSAIATERSSIVIENGINSYKGNNFRLSLGLGNNTSKSNDGSNGSGTDTDGTDTGGTDTGGTDTGETDTGETDAGETDTGDEAQIDRIIVLEVSSGAGLEEPYDYLTDGNSSGERAILYNSDDQITFEILEAGRLKIDVGAPYGTFSSGPYASYGGLIIETLDRANVVNAEDIILTKRNTFTISPESVYAGTITTPFSLQKGKYKVSAYSGGPADENLDVSFYDFTILPSTPMPTTDVEVIRYTTDSTYPMAYNVADGDIEPEIDERFEAGNYNRNRDVNTTLEVNIKKSGYVILHTNVDKIVADTYYMLVGPNALAPLNRYNLYKEYINDAGNIAYITDEKIPAGPYEIWTDSRSEESVQGEPNQFALESVFITEVEVTNSNTLSPLNAEPDTNTGLLGIEQVYINGEFSDGDNLLDNSQTIATTISENDFIDIDIRNALSLSVFLAPDKINGASYGSLRISDPISGDNGDELLSYEYNFLFQDSLFDYDISGFSGGWLDLPFRFTQEKVRISASEGSNFIISEVKGNLISHKDTSAGIPYFNSFPLNQSSMSLYDNDVGLPDDDKLKFNFSKMGSYILTYPLEKSKSLYISTNSTVSNLTNYKLELSNFADNALLMNDSGDVISEDGKYIMEAQRDPNNSSKAMFKTPFTLDSNRSMYKIRVLEQANNDDDVILTEIEFK